MTSRNYLPVPVAAGATISQALQAQVPQNIVYLRTRHWLGVGAASDDPVVHQHIAPVGPGNSSVMRMHQAMLGQRVRAIGVENGDAIMVRSSDVEVALHIPRARQHTPLIGIGYRNNLALSAPLNGQSGE